jgi:hypothetical protein
MGGTPRDASRLRQDQPDAPREPYQTREVVDAETLHDLCAVQDLPLPRRQAGQGIGLRGSRLQVARQTGGLEPLLFALGALLRSGSAVVVLDVGLARLRFWLAEPC